MVSVFGYIQWDNRLRSDRRSRTAKEFTFCITVTDFATENKVTEHASIGTIQIPPNKDFVVEVSDDERRFQPFQFTASLPARGVFNGMGWTTRRPPLASVPLFSSPVRTAPGGMAIIRAELWDTSIDARPPGLCWKLHDGKRRIGAVSQMSRDASR